MYFSYSQFFVFDRSVKLPACAWTETHHDQGFARRERNAVFATLLEFGHAEVTVTRGAYTPRETYQRVIEVPIEVQSGTVIVSGPEEFDDDRTTDMPSGSYRLTVAQAVVADDQECIDLYFERVTEPALQSRIIVADESLRPADPLLETAEEVVL
jgi:Competence protein J (ComJ)